PLNAFWTALPPVESNGLGNPLTVVGLGAARDQSDYAKQCAPGQPLKPAEDAEARTQRVAEAASLKSFPALAQSGDSRVQVRAPTNGQEFAPGDSVNVTVTISASISVAGAFVGTTVPGLGPLTPTKSSATTYQASFAIPSNYTGSLRITPAVVDVNKNPIAGVGVTVNVVPLTAPVSLSIRGGSYIHLRSAPSTSRLSVLGNYANNTQLNLTTSATGTTYSSSNPSILSVDTEGKVQALSYGTSVVTVENKGVKTYAVFVVEQPASPLPPQDVTHSVAMASSGFQLNRNTGFFVQTVQISNALSTPAAGPLYLVLENLPAGVTLVGSQAGKTQQIPTARSPYLKLKLPNGWLLQPGTSLSLSLQFLNPNRVQISYTPKVYRTLGKP
ncbi:MAG TPA: hypothetical protein VKV79_07415, partial [Terriglobia bacterium]|nr:hypothetical protein [Terriglobia bacterium]